MSARKEQRVEAGTTVNDVSRVNASTRTSDRRPETDTAPGFTVTGEIAVHRGAVSGVAVSNDGALLVVTHFGADSLSLIDTATGAVAQTVIDIDEPFAVAMSDMSAGCAYVSSVSAAYDSVLAFDTDANRVVATYPLAFSVTDLAVSPDGRRVYAGRTAVDGADVAIIDTATGHDNTISVATTAGTTIACVRVSPDGRRLYVAANSASAAELVVIDTRQNRVVSTIEIGSPIRDIALSPEGSTAYVGSCGPDFGTVLDIVDVRASAITNTYKIGDAAGVLAQLAMSRNGQRAYLVGDQSVTVLSTSTRDIIGSIEIGGQPSCAIESADGKRLYIADYAGVVTVLGIAAPTAPADAPTSDDEATAAQPWAIPDLWVLEPTLA
jgi:DNA-binding beta-propeller fold protein YncE